MAWLDRVIRSTLHSSFLWGGALSVGYYLALEQSHDWVNPFVLRFLAGRWEAYACMCMFFVAAASLVIRMVDQARQAMLLRRPVFGSPGDAQSPPAMAGMLLKQLDGQPPALKQTCLHRRLCDALCFVQRKGTAESLDEHLRLLADNDAAKMSSGYAVVRFMSWTIPAVGSLGTVLGIAAAIAQLSAQAPTDPISGVTEGLALAFDTTALSLALSILLMCVKFASEQQEVQLLAAVEDRASQELSGRFSGQVTPRNSSSDQMRQLTERIVQATEKLAHEQARIAQLPLGQASAQSNGAASSEQLEAVVARAVSQAMAGQPLGRSWASGGESQPADWTQLQQALQQIADFFARQQEQQSKDIAVAAELAEAVQEGSANWPVRKLLHSRPEGSPGESVAGLWTALSD